MGKKETTETDTVSWTNNKGPEATPTTKITLTRNLQEPEHKHLQTTIREGKAHQMKRKRKAKGSVKKRRKMILSRKGRTTVTARPKRCSLGPQ